jgi:hypothetical protein
MTARFHLCHWTALALFLACAEGVPWVCGQGSDTVAMREDFRPGYQYHVDCRVNIRGELILPLQQGQTVRTRVPVVGKSVIKYDERILEVKEGKVDRTVRSYDKMEFERQAGKDDQRGSLRQAVRRLVILRHQHVEVPFSAEGRPLLWDELDMIRTDVFTPALAGLLPAGKVRPGDSWYADLAAIQELTDLEKITTGQLTCVFQETAQFGGRPCARVSFKGKVSGVGEDGPAQHDIDGHLWFDLTSQHLSYLSMTGTQYLVDKSGQPTGGRVEGTFVLTREAAPRTTELSDARLKGLDLQPNEQNTLLWFYNAEVGASLLYPRNWHVAGVNGVKRQVGLDEKRGSGILISLDTAANIPTAAVFQKEVAATLARQNMKLVRQEPARTLAPGLETCFVQGEAAGKKAFLQYFLVRQKDGGAVVTANLQEFNAAAAREVERIARSLVVSRPTK